MANVRGSVLLRAMTAVAVTTMSSIAVAQPMPALAAPLFSSANAPAITNFYNSRQGAPLWFRAGVSPTATLKLVELLRRAPSEGVKVDPQLAAAVEGAIARAATGNAAAVNEADRLVSNAWVAYVQALRAPTPGMIYGDPAVRYTPERPELVIGLAGRAPSLAEHVEQVAGVNPLYRALRDAALTDPALTTGPDAGKLAANLDRVRSIPASGRYIVVDAAGARLWMFEGGQAVDSMKVIVGTVDTPTPMVASMIHYTTLNPYWHVPNNLLLKTIAPNVLKRGKGYLKTSGYEVVSAWSNDAQVISPDDVDWKAVAAGKVEIKVRQLPGGTNSMGKMKFAFANGEGIFLHDTPQKEKFDLSNRAVSNGCIRLEDAPRLARFLMGNDPKMASSEPDQHLRLPQGMPVYVTYLTAQPTNGKVTFVNDVYGLDRSAVSRVAAVSPASSTNSAAN